MTAEKLTGKRHWEMETVPGQPECQLYKTKHGLWFAARPEEVTCTRCQQWLRRQGQLPKAGTT